MVVIRMRRAGSKNRAVLPNLVSHSGPPPDGPVNKIKCHNKPRTNPPTLVIDRDRYAFWLKSGATASDTLRTIITRVPEPVAADAPAAL